MAEAGSIAAISIPFVTGAALAALLPRDWPYLYPAGAVCSVLAAVFVCVILARSTHWGVSCCLYFALGALCRIGAQICAPPQGPDLFAPELESLCGIIDGIPWSDDGAPALVKALLTGRRDSLDRDTITAFRRSGASHILALSGLHLGILYGILSGMLKVIGKSRAAYTVRCVVVIGAAGFYTVMTGASPSLVRAFLFIVMNEASRMLSGRERKPVRVLLAAATLQVAFSPLSIDSIAFQLSYLAMIGIILINPWIDRIYPQVQGPSPMRRIWSAVSVTLSCQVTTAPLVWVKFGTFPRYFLLTNLLALPLTELLMFCAVGTVTLSGIGICPPVCVHITEKLAAALELCLEIISTM